MIVDCPSKPRFWFAESVGEYVILLHAPFDLRAVV